MRWFTPALPVGLALLLACGQSDEQIDTAKNEASYGDRAAGEVLGQADQKSENETNKRRSALC